MIDRPPHQPDRQQLFDIASEQHGNFTTEQAAQCGCARYMLTYHVRQGTFERVHRGVYRLRGYTSSPVEPVIAAWLAVGRDAAVVSHASALELWDLSDVVPETATSPFPASDAFVSIGLHRASSSTPPRDRGATAMFALTKASA